jgi:hypothetical protein
MTETRRKVQGGSIEALEVTGNSLIVGALESKIELVRLGMERLNLLKHQVSF